MAVLDLLKLPVSGKAKAGAKVAGYSFFVVEALRYAADHYHVATSVPSDLREFAFAVVGSGLVGVGTFVAAWVAKHQPALAHDVAVAVDAYDPTLNPAKGLSKPPSA